MSSPPIQELEPDYVLSVRYPVADDERRARKNLEAVVDALYHRGFYAQVRPHDHERLLVFVKISPESYQRAATNDRLKDFEFGVPSGPLGPTDRLRIIHHALVSPQLVGGAGLGQLDCVEAVVPLAGISAAGGAAASGGADGASDSVARDVQLHALDASLSTDTIRERFGARIALYFEFAKYYTAWLAVLAVFGVVSTLKLRNRFLMTYTFVNLAWGLFFLTFWERRERVLLNTWGVANTHRIAENDSQLDRLNAQRQAPPRAANADGRRFLRQLAFVPIALVFVCVLVLYQLGCFVVEIFLSEIYDGPGKILLTLVPTVLILVFVPVLTIVFNKVAQLHIRWEAHTSEYSRRNSALLKQFVLTFLTSYMPLLITLFVYLPFAHLIKPNLSQIEHLFTLTVERLLGHRAQRYLARLKRQEDFEYNQERLNAQFFYFVVTNQVVQMLLKYVLPHVMSWGTRVVNERLGKGAVAISDAPRERAYLERVRGVLALPEYSVNDDYRALVVQYGYLIVFGPVWLLAPLVLVVFNVLTFKLDVMKLRGGKYFRPPVPQRVDTIHPWKYALFLLTWLGLLVLPVISAFYRHNTRPVQPPADGGALGAARHHSRGIFGKAHVHGSGANLVLLLFVSEHVFFVAWFLLARVSSLFKSDVETRNDVGVSDVKLRRDYYTAQKREELPQIASAGEWLLYSADDVLQEASTIMQREVGPKGHSEPAPAPTLAEPQRATGDDEVEKSSDDDYVKSSDKLKRIKDPSDRIVELNSGGKTLYATMDNNEHFVPPEVVTGRESARSEASSASSVVEGEGGDAEVARKRSTLKRLLLKKKQLEKKQ